MHRRAFLLFIYLSIFFYIYFLNYLFYNDYETSYTTYINHARWLRCLRSVVLEWEEMLRTIEKRTEHK